MDILICLVELPFNLSQIIIGVCETVMERTFSFNV